jgi:hypothetical protein
MVDPLYGLFGDARRLYRFNAPWLLGLSAAVLVPAGAVDVLVTSRHWPGAWCHGPEAAAPAEDPQPAASGA